jgi:soluble lytic murein transglycosylase-like protein
MRNCVCRLLLILAALNSSAQSHRAASRLEAEYYVSAYARHYQVPVQFVRAIIRQESGWRTCVVSREGAAGLMQLMPLTAARLGVGDRCNIGENVAGGIRYLAWLRQKFAGDLRLVAAAYLAGEEVIARRGLLYRNREVVAYVARIRADYLRQLEAPQRGYGPLLRSRTVR